MSEAEQKSSRGRLNQVEIKPGYFAWAVVVLFFVVHWGFVIRYAVDVPFWDEWGEFPRRPFLPWIFQAHNEHLIVTTKLLVLGLWYLNGWDIASQQILNFLIFGVTLGVLGMAIRRAVPDLPSWVLAGLILFCLSPMAYENHTWGFQTQWHLKLLFVFLGTYLWFSVDAKGRTWGRFLSGLAAFVLACYSLASGIVSTVAVVGLFAVGVVLNARKDHPQRRRDLSQLVVALLVLGAALAFELTLMRKEPAADFRASPLTLQFWYFYLSLMSAISYVSNAAQIQIAIGAAIVAFVAGPFLWVTARRRDQMTDGSNLLLLFALSWAVLCALLAIALGRGAFSLEMSLSSRYQEFTMMLVPLAFASWWVVLGVRPKLRSRFLAVAGVLTALVWGYSLRYFKYYPLQHQERVVALEKLRSCLYTAGSCTIGIDSAPVTKERIRQAESMNLSFMRRVKSTESLRQ